MATSPFAGSKQSREVTPIPSVRSSRGSVAAPRRQSRHDQTALHIAASVGNAYLVRVLLDAGADPNDAGDDAGIGVMGWATFVGPPREISMDVVSLLLAQGGRHSIFSAIALALESLLAGAFLAAATPRWWPCF